MFSGMFWWILHLLGAQGFDAGEDVFGDFLSGSAASPAQGVPHHHSATAPPSNASSYVEPKQLGNEVLCENSTLSSAGEITSVKKTEGAPKEKKGKLGIRRLFKL